MMRAGLGWLAGGTGAGLAAVAVVVGVFHSGSEPGTVALRQPAPVVVAAPVPTATPSPTPTPAPQSTSSGSSTGSGGHYSGGASSAGASRPAYHPPATLYDLRIASVGIAVPVIAVGVVHGAMDAPFGPASSPVWHEGFWLNLGAQPGQSGTMTIAGHLDDTLGRPGAFWTLHNVQPGQIVQVTRRSDGVTVRYRISEVDSYTNSQANSPDVIHRIYGSAGGGTDDGVARITLITCTGRYVNGEYNHRFVAYGELIS
jgi:Sortase domain